MAYVKKAVLAKRIRVYEKDKLPTERAYEIHKLFQKMNGFKPSADIHKFLATSSYTHFLKLQNFVIQVNIPDVVDYLKAMRHHKRRQNVWCNNWSYRLYHEYMDEQYPPIQAIENTVNELFDMADTLDMKVNDVVDELMLSEVMLLMRQRRLSPWIILHSSKIKDKLFHAPEAIQDEFIKMYDQDTWVIKFSQNPTAVSTAKAVIKELHI